MGIHAILLGRFLWCHRRFAWAFLGSFAIWLAFLVGTYNVLPVDKVRFISDALGVDGGDVAALLLSAWPSLFVPLALGYVGYRSETVRAVGGDAPPDAIMLTAGRLTLYLAIMILVASGLLPIVEMLGVKRS